VVSSGHDVADARLHREVAAALAAGLSVEVHGLGSAADGPPGAVVHARPRPRGIPARLLLALAQPWRARGAVLLTLDPDVVPAAWLAARLRRRRLVVDVHEDYTALLRDRTWASGPAGRVAAAAVRAVLVAARRADLVVVADDHVPPAAGSLPAQRRLVVRNSPWPGHLPGPADSVAAGAVDAGGGAELRAVYIGDVRTSRGLRTMLDGVQAAPGWSLDVVGPVAAADQAHVDHWLATSPAAGRVRFHGRLPPARAWQVAAGARVGLCMLEDTPAFRDAVPSKLYEYLAAGLAVVSTDLPRCAAIVADSGGGAVVHDAAGLSATLCRWAEQPDELERIRRDALVWARRTFAGRSPYDELAEQVRLLARGRGGSPATQTATRSEESR
jgi:glycosyltransferase involved in cell wall biosynthesis